MNAPNQLSFLPEDYLENKAQRRANVICAILFLVTMVTIGFAFTTGERSLADMQKLHAAKYLEVSNAAKRIDQFKELQEKQRTMAHQAELSAALLEKVPRSLILAKITNSLPQGCSLTDLAMSSTKHNSPNASAAPRTAFEAKQAKNSSPIPDVAEAKVYDVTLKIGGRAPTDTQVGELIQRLKVVPLFKDVNLIISDSEKPGDKKSDDPEYRKFQIEMTLDPNADAQSLDATATASVNPNK
jgi:Tfp pilus assembly protein PilN